MRISEFAKKFKLSTSAVRFYINQGLLMPDKKKDQYEFGIECIADMEKLLKYKRCRFSLEEIQELRLKGCHPAALFNRSSDAVFACILLRFHVL